MLRGLVDVRQPSVPAALRFNDLQLIFSRRMISFTDTHRDSAEESTVAALVALEKAAGVRGPSAANCVGGRRTTDPVLPLGIGVTSP